MGRGRDPQGAGPARQGQQQAPYGGSGAPGHPGAPAGGYGGGPQQWGHQPGGYDEPEYLGGGAPQQPGYGQQGQHGRPGPYGQPAQYGQPYGGGAPAGGPAPYPGDPGQTQQFSLGEAPDAYDPYGDGGGHTAPAPPPGPRLHWKELLSGIVLRPNDTFWRMRDHQMWAPALIVTFVYGLLAVFGFDKARKDVLGASLADVLPAVLVTGVIMVVAGLILGAVTHTLARQLGGDGIWQPTVGLSMLIMSISDAPRLLFAMFLGGDSTLVQVLGWATWLAGGVLLTSMVSKSHDLPWPRALGASAIQLVALLSLIKLGTL